MARSRLSILSNAEPTDLKTEPYPHLVIRDALDPEIFTELNSQFPNSETVMNGRDKLDTWYAYQACASLKNTAISPIWKKFIEYHVSKNFYFDFLDIFEKQIDVYYPNLDRVFSRGLLDYSVDMRQPGESANPKNLIADVSLECQFYVNFTENPREVRGPHVDRPTELFAALLYFRKTGDDSTGGDLEICSAVDEAQLYPAPDSIRVDHLPMEVNRDRVNITNVVKYEENTLVIFLNTYKSMHSISERSATPVPRRHINFTADLFKLPAPGLFDVRRPASKRLKKWLGNQPVVWRLASLIKD